MVKIYHTNTNQKKSALALLISDKTDFRARNNIRDKEAYYLMTEDLILQTIIILLLIIISDSNNY